MVCSSVVPYEAEEEDVRRREEGEKKRAGRKEEHSHVNFTRKILQISLPAKPTNIYSQKNSMQ